MVVVKKKRFFSRKRILLATLVVIISCGVIFTLEKAQIINLYSKNSPTDSDAKTTSTTATAQENFDEGDYREPGNSLSENRGDGNISDNNGAIDSNIDTTNPIVSATGEISVYAPLKDSTVSSGAQVAGTSSLSKVSYRLIDSVSGVIATGELNVVAGKFSGQLIFSSSAPEGRLDIYGIRDDFSEFSNIEIPLGFQ